MLDYKYGKYENYIRVGEIGGELKDFPTPSSMGYAYRDTDKDPFTDLEGYTHRNRVRHDVLQLEVSWDVLGEEDIEFILNLIGHEWINLEVIDKHTRNKKVYKVYASDKEFDTFRVWKDSNNKWHEVSTALQVTFTEQ